MLLLPPPTGQAIYRSCGPMLIACQVEAGAPSKDSVLLCLAAVLPLDIHASFAAREQGMAKDLQVFAGLYAFVLFGFANALFVTFNEGLEAGL